jgi:hypothetical protein
LSFVNAGIYTITLVFGMMLDGCISVGVVFTQVGALFVCDAVFSKDDDLSQ